MLHWFSSLTKKFSSKLIKLTDFKKSVIVKSSAIRGFLNLLLVLVTIYTNIKLFTFMKISLKNDFCEIATVQRSNTLMVFEATFLIYE